MGRRGQRRQPRAGILGVRLFAVARPGEAGRGAMFHQPLRGVERRRRVRAGGEVASGAGVAAGGA